MEREFKIDSNEEFTAQEVFNTIYRDAKTRTIPSTGGDFGECVYRSSINGVPPCLMGARFSDESYDPGMEEKAIDAVLESFFPGKHVEHYELLIELQKCHDRAESSHDLHNFNKRMMTMIESVRIEFDLKPAD